VTLKQETALLVDTKADLRLRACDQGGGPRTWCRGGPRMCLRGPSAGEPADRDDPAEPSSCRFLHAERCKEYELRQPKGVLLYGPPRLR